MRRVRSIRGAFLALVGLQTALLLTVATALVSTIVAGQRILHELEQALVSVRAVEEVQVNLFEATRYHQLYGETGDPRWQALAAASEADLLEDLATARAQVSSAEERALVDRLIAQVDSIRREVLRRPPAEGTVHREDVLGAQETADALIQLNERTAAAVAAGTQRRNRAATAIAAAGILLALAGFVLTLVTARRLLYEPVRQLREALARRSLESVETIPEEGPDEIRQIVGGINDLIQRLADQRAQQFTFLAAVSHDLRNPMASLRTAAELAARHNEDPTQQRRMQIILRQVDRLNRLVEDLMDFSRIGAGRFELHLVEADLREVVQETVELFSDASEKHEIRVVLPDRPIVVSHDPTRIGQVLGNLLSNAIKYAPEGGPVDVSLEADGDQAVVRVHDRGMGIDPAHRERIFTAFERSASVDAEIPGVGLGLAVARRLARAHGGDIVLESSEPRRGSTFALWLPLRAGGDPRRATAPARRASDVAAAEA